MKFWLKIRQFKFTQIKSKTLSFFQIKTDHKLELLIPETTKLLGTGKKDVGKYREAENVPNKEYVELALVHCDLVKNIDQHTSIVLFTFAPNKYSEN